LQIAPAALDLRAQPNAGAHDVVAAARATHGEMDVLGRRNPKTHEAAGKFEAHVGADASAIQLGTKVGSAVGAHLGRVRDFRADDDRL